MSAGKNDLAARARCFAGAVLDMVSGRSSEDDLDRIAELVKASYAREQELRGFMDDVNTEIVKLAVLKGWLDTFPATSAGRPDDPELAVVWRVRRILDAGL